MTSSPRCVKAFEASKQDRALVLDELPKTHLFPCLLTMNWELAQSRCKKYDAEARHWVTKRDQNNNLKWLRLPIHQACICEPTTAVITSLLEAYPKGVYETDNNERLPIHLACIHGASTYVVYMLLAAYPDGAYEKDIFGSLPSDYVASSSSDNKEELTSLFLKGATAYEFGDSERVKIHELKVSCERRLAEPKAEKPAEPATNDLVKPSTKESADPDSPTHHYEIELEEVEKEVPAEVLMSRSIIRGLEEQLEAALAALDKSKQEATALKNANDILEKKIEEELSEKEIVPQAMDKIASLEKELSVVSKRNSNMRYGFEKLEQTVIALESGLKKKDAKLKEVSAKLLSVETERDTQLEVIAEWEAGTQLKEINDKLEKTEAERDEMKEQLAKTEAERDEMREKLEKTEAEIDEMKEKLEKTEEERDEMREKLEKTEAERDEMKEKLEKTEAERDEMKEKVETVEMQNSRLEEENKKLNSENIRVNVSLKSYENYQGECENRFDILEQKITDLEGENAALIRIINDVRSAFNTDFTRESRMTRLLDAAANGDSDYDDDSMSG